MLDASRHDNELALLHPFGRLVAELHTKTALYYEKEFVLMIVMMKHELAFDLIQLDLLSVEVGGNVGFPVFGDFGELFRDVYFTHYFPPTGLSDSGEPGRSQKFQKNNAG